MPRPVKLTIFIDLNFKQAAEDIGEGGVDAIPLPPGGNGDPVGGKLYLSAVFCRCFCYKYLGKIGVSVLR